LNNNLKISHHIGVPYPKSTLKQTKYNKNVIKLTLQLYSFVADKSDLNVQVDY
jgi:hypothetical protein